MPLPQICTRSPFRRRLRLWSERSEDKQHKGRGPDTQKGEDKQHKRERTCCTKGGNPRRTGAATAMQIGGGYIFSACRCFNKQNFSLNLQSALSFIYKTTLLVVFMSTNPSTLYSFPLYSFPLHSFPFLSPSRLFKPTKPNIE